MWCACAQDGRRVAPHRGDVGGGQRHRAPVLGRRGADALLGREGGGRRAGGARLRGRPQAARRRDGPPGPRCAHPWLRAALLLGSRGVEGVTSTFLLANVGQLAAGAARVDHGVLLLLVVRFCSMCAARCGGQGAVCSGFLGPLVLLACQRAVMLIDNYLTTCLVFVLLHTVDHAGAKACQQLPWPSPSDSDPRKPS